MFLRTSHLLSRSQPFVPGRLCKYYVTSTIPTEKPTQDINRSVPLPSVIPMMPPPPELISSSSSLPSSSSTSNLIEGDFIVLEEPNITYNNDNSSINTMLQHKIKSNHSMLPSIDLSPPMGHHFDTYALVERLHTEGGFSREQARIIMEIMQYQIRDRVHHAKNEYLPKTQLENETQVLNASIDDLKNNITVQRKNDAALLNAELSSLAREIENLELQLNEDIHYLQSSIDLTLNDFRAEIRQEPKRNMIETQEVNHRLTVLLADSNMSLERLKWETIWQSLLSIIATGMGLSVIGYGLSSIRTKLTPPIIQQTELDETLTFADMEL
ncbi:hypothetical protein BJ944DRAFT_288692 [Cunninghamella echinulata]|nr:hypothetical protein BJ944DRAFT_288692 [Cunninghamella echinulata]